jgi:hypothetical protein
MIITRTIKIDFVSRKLLKKISLVVWIFFDWEQDKFES